ncbi:MAG: SPOR domain-containing protein [Pseudomonadota bacterium]
MKLKLSRIKLGVVLISVLLQSCAVGALLESTVEVQPVLKSAGQSNAAMDPPAMVDQSMPHGSVTTGSSAPVFVPPAQVETIQESHVARQTPSLGALLPAAPPAPVAQPSQYVAPVMSQSEMPPQPRPQRSISTSGGMYLQVGMFRSVSGARQVKANAQAATNVPVTINDDRPEQYRVLVGPFPQHELPQVRSQLDRAGFSYFRFSR